MAKKGEDSKTPVRAYIVFGVAKSENGSKAYTEVGTANATNPKAAIKAVTGEPGTFLVVAARGATLLTRKSETKQVDTFA